MYNLASIVYGVRETGVTVNINRHILQPLNNRKQKSKAKSNEGRGKLVPVKHDGFLVTREKSKTGTPLHRLMKLFSSLKIMAAMTKD
jgi:hypothetical protein